MNSTTELASGAPAAATAGGAEAGDEPSGEPPDNSAAGDPRQYRVELNLLAAETDPPVTGWLEVQLARIAARAQAPSGCLSVAIVDERRMAAMHRQYKQLDGPTDVLAFDLGCAAGGALDAELLLCRDVAVRQAAARGHTVRLELLLYAVHGLLHVLGYDDDAEHAAAMHRREDELLTAVGLEATYARGESTE